MKELYLNIKSNIEEGHLNKALTTLETAINAHPKDDMLIYLRGCISVKKQEWKEAVKLFRQAKQINPESPAVEAEKMVFTIMNFYNKDLYNP